MLIRRPIMILQNLSVMTFILPNNAQFWLVILEHHHFHLLSIFLPLIPISHYYPLEIQDVGEDNSVSSLHLFFGNMDLPPSSYHDSLEELWDEEEESGEIETVMKVVSSVYHQYLDVFSKSKAEKIPPHHACDHHIKLEGSLPPVRVIYSLSNQ
ncbi:hypothetical protein O181_063869 [Austropuccinia psidii MF-1]|uniref:Uncharacterized protein n=1 Tax=Austropuccinia psidii MF-1 TaxID=1389203 RepID=A0A9Q3I2Z6_9BASI|nr:hypothetical protein [Austropuccinia psidii MF-1]